MSEVVKKKPRVLLLYYSFSGQTSGVLHHLALGLDSMGVEVVLERIHPVSSLRFPIGSVTRTVKMMLTTTLRCRVAIEPLSPLCFEDYNLIILAGPTWSYNPSGPILSLFDRDGRRLFAERLVLPLISCRRYWRVHLWSLRQALRVCGARVVNRVVFTHPTPEPWVTIGVFMKLAGMNPEKSGFMRRFYKKYGHSRRQLDEAQAVGEKIGRALRDGLSLADLTLPPI